MKKRTTLIIIIAIILVAGVIGGAFLHQHILIQREIVEQERQERIHDTRYSILVRGHFSIEEHGDPMEASLVVIAFAGLRSIGFSHEQVEAFLIEDENHPDFETISAFVAPQGGWQDFANGLFRVYLDNFDAINATFPEFELVYHRRPDNLPIPVLHYVIALWEAENE